MIILNPFVQQHPDAVFIWRTRMESMQEYTPERLAAVGRTVARDLLCRVDAPGASGTQAFVVKPNICGGPREGEDPSAWRSQPGESTSVDVVRGFLEVMHTLGAAYDRITLVEGRSILDLEAVFRYSGYEYLCGQLGVRLMNNGRDPYGPEELNWVELPQGVVFRQIPLVRPANDGGVDLINIATMKAHPLALTTLCVKNLQGLVAFRYKHFCHELEMLEKGEGCYTPEVLSAFQPDLRQRLEPGFARHRQDDPQWTMRDELYANRACDTLLAVRPMVCIVEGVLARGGTGYRRGTDVLANTLVAGLNPVHVDAVATYLMGQDPNRPNYLRLAAERGFGTRDPFAVELYLMIENGPECADLGALARLELDVTLSRR
ncbi:MAG: DUF362 domain-containing protein [Candidatus Latescibacterota bacterium]